MPESPTVTPENLMNTLLDKRTAGAEEHLDAIRSEVTAIVASKISHSERDQLAGMIEPILHRLNHLRDKAKDRPDAYRQTQAAAMAIAETVLTLLKAKSI